MRTETILRIMRNAGIIICAGTALIWACVAALIGFKMLVWIAEAF